MPELYHTVLAESPPFIAVCTDPRMVNAGSIRGFEFNGGYVAVDSEEIRLSNTGKFETMFASLGLSNTQIAGLTHQSTKSVKNHLGNTYNILYDPANCDVPASPRAKLARYLFSIGAYQVERFTEPIGFTVQEHKAVHLASFGMSLEQIGKQLCLTPRTVKNYLYNASQRVALNRRGALIMASFFSGIISVSSLIDQ